MVTQANNEQKRITKNRRSWEALQNYAKADAW